MASVASPAASRDLHAGGADPDDIYRALRPSATSGDGNFRYRAREFRGEAGTFRRVGVWKRQRLIGGEMAFSGSGNKLSTFSTNLRLPEIFSVPVFSSAFSGAPP